MREWHLFRGIAAIASMLFFFQSDMIAEGGWKAGVARARITPDESMWLAGYGSRTNASQGKIHDLWIKALALEDANGRRAVVLASDLLGFPRNMSDPICAALRDLHGLERERVMLSASHTHSAPVLRGALYDIYPLDDAQRAKIEAQNAKDRAGRG